MSDLRLGNRLGESTSLEDRKFFYPHFLQSELNRGTKNPDPIDYAPFKTDRRCIVEVFCWAAYFPYFKIKIYGLGQYFVVKDKIIGVLFQRKGLQYLFTEGSVTGVVF